MTHYDLSDTFVYTSLARVNPIYAPRRKEKNAAKWAEVIQAIAVACQGRRSCEPSLAEWAAIRHLDESSLILWPTWTTNINWPTNAGSCRRQARDRGGIMGAATEILAKIILNQDYVDRMTFTAWGILFPKTASIRVYGAECLDEWDIIRPIKCESCHVSLEPQDVLHVGSNGLCSTCAPNFVVNEKGDAVLKTESCDVCGSDVFNTVKYGELALCSSCHDASVEGNPVG